MGLFRQKSADQNRYRLTIINLALGMTGLLLAACTLTPVSAKTPLKAAVLATAIPTQTATVEGAAMPMASPSQQFSKPTPPATSFSFTPTSAPASTTSAQSLSGSVAINIVEPPFQSPQTWTYEPAMVTVKVGTKVTWTNTGAVMHTVTADDGRSFDSKDMKPGATFSFTPASAGTFAYHCTFHPWMKGTFIVTPQ